VEEKMADAMMAGSFDQAIAERQMTGGIRDFLFAQQKAQISGIVSVLTGRKDQLPTLEREYSEISPSNQSYIGVKSIDTHKIVGSESRSSDFSKNFMPKRRFLLHRWTSINIAYYTGNPLPAIQVFELNGKYYVRDGNHRVSVAKFHRVRYLDAEVVRLSA
jgi:hypothetical protein